MTVVRLLIAAVVAMVCSSPAFAVVVFSDGFGDADLDNNGTPLEDVDTNVQGSLADTTYVPGRLEDGSGTEPENNELTSVLDASDTGIRWIQMRGFTNSVSTNTHPGPGNSKPTIRIVDDGQDVMQETMAGGPGGLGVTAIDDGYAMSWESRGGGSSAAGFFDQRISLGPEVDDEVKVSFDFRIWRDAPNLNGSNPNNVPTQGELRFGLFQDTDNQIGMTNPFAGRQVDGNGDPFPDQNNQFAPAVWGFEEGLFEGGMTGQHGAGDDIGTNGDNGWTASVFMGNATLPNGGGTRIREELQSDRILQGSDVHTIVQPEDLDPDPFGFDFDFINMDLDKVYNISLSLKRATDTDPGDTIAVTLTITDKETMVATSLSGQEQLDDHTSGGVPVPGTGGIQSDSWDYFAIRNASSGSAEFDFILDNFLIEVIGSNEPMELAGDYNNNGVVDAADYTKWRDNVGTSNLLDNDLIGGVIGPAHYDQWANNFGNSLGAGALAGSSASVPEPTGVLLLCFGAASVLILARNRR